MIPKAEQRKIAISACRSILRKRGATERDLVYEVSAGDALLALDDLSRAEQDKVAALWYASASANQIRLFGTEWRKWQAYWRIEHELRGTQSDEKGIYYCAHCDEDTYTVFHLQCVGAYTFGEDGEDGFVEFVDPRIECASCQNEKELTDPQFVSLMKRVNEGLLK